MQREDGSYGTVGATRVVRQAQAMYNLTVDQAHTFFVGDGQWLVHNVECGWIKKDVYSRLEQLAGPQNAKKFEEALEKGIVGPVNEAGIKVLNPPHQGYTHELKILNSAQRILGKVQKWKGEEVIVFDYFVRKGLHP